MEPAALVIQLLIAAINNASKLGALLQRGNITQDDVNNLLADDKVARSELQATIDAAKATGG